MNTLSVEDLIAKAKNLPPSPEILPKLLTVLQDDESTNWEVARLISLDQSLTSQILTWSNSGFYGFSSPSFDIEEAIARVGMNEIYKLVGIVIGKRLTNQSAEFYGLDQGELWENSLGAAFSMETIANRIGEDATICYTIGLLHSIGKIVIDQTCHDAYPEVFKLVEEQQLPLIQAEEQVIGFNHAQVGAALLHKWNFRKNVCEPVQYQFTPSASISYRKSCCLMNLCHLITTSIGHNFGRASMAFTVDPVSLQETQLNENDLQMVIMDSHQKILDIKSQLL